ncbi:hypothetical protein BZA77DRAFT_289780 [Pyronema omphalodes]|nr:hypothetical protein BZA77DRAFT_289780 [Pyronema omphalodes]
MHIHAYNFASLVRLVLLITGLVLLFENPRIVVCYIIPAVAAFCILPKVWVWWQRMAGVDTVNRTELNELKLLINKNEALKKRCSLLTLEIAYLRSENQKLAEINAIMEEGIFGARNRGTKRRTSNFKAETREGGGIFCGIIAISVHIQSWHSPILSRYSLPAQEEPSDSEKLP